MEKKLIFPAYVMLESENESILRDELAQYKGISGKVQTVLEINPKEEKILNPVREKESYRDVQGCDPQWGYASDRRSVKRDGSPDLQNRPA